MNKMRNSTETETIKKIKTRNSADEKCNDQIKVNQINKPKTKNRTSKSDSMQQKKQ